MKPTDKDKRIAKFFTDGCTLQKIARKIGQPTEITRVIEGLRRVGIEIECYKHCEWASQCDGEVHVPCNL